MKLLTKTTLYNLMFMLLALAAGGVLLFVVISSIIREEFDEKLKDEKTQLIKYLSVKDSVPENMLVIGGNLKLVPEGKLTEDKLCDTIFYSNTEKEMIAYRQIIFSTKINNNIYQVTISKPLVESEDLVEAIVVVILVIIIAIMLIIALFNIYISKRMWKPFKDSLEKIKLFNLSQSGSPEFSKTGIKEFSELNIVLEGMTKRIVTEFSRMKEFSENVSHELQTPLSLIKIKLEMMMQSKVISEEQFKDVTELYDSMNRLSKINQTLILMTRIGNRQFKEVAPVDIADVIKAKLNHYQELIACNNIEVGFDIRETLKIKMNPELADIFIGNLISNAIRHNIEKGQIQILLDFKGMTITNTGKPLLVSPGELFERFKKNDQSSQSMGLGLAIVKQIADLYMLQISYSYSDLKHTVTVRI
jgi:signal transduction histidine kinase